MDKPDALLLAEAMSLAFPGNLGIDKAAAELRRLHKENELLASAADKLRMSHSEERRELLRQRDQATAQRDALLEVLKYLDKEFRQHGRQHWPEAIRVRAAIKAVEEGK